MCVSKTLSYKLFKMYIQFFFIIAYFYNSETMSVCYWNDQPVNKYVSVGVREGWSSGRTRWWSYTW